jgi:hypothetical protein
MKRYGLLEWLCVSLSKDPREGGNTHIKLQSNRFHNVVTSYIVPEMCQNKTKLMLF